jgi:hypothetical protein
MPQASMSAFRSVSGLNSARKSRRSSITSTPAALASSISASMPATLSAVTLVQMDVGSEGSQAAGDASGVACGALVARRAVAARGRPATGGMAGRQPSAGVATRPETGRGPIPRARGQPGRNAWRDARAIWRVRVGRGSVGV